MQEGQAVLADLDLVVVLEHGRLDPLAVHVGAVEAPQVADRERLALPDDLGMSFPRWLSLDSFSNGSGPKAIGNRPGSGSVS